MESQNGKILNGTTENDKETCKKNATMNLNLNTNSNVCKAQSPKTPQRSTPLLTPKTPPVTPDSPNKYDDDVDSLRSYSTTASLFSCTDHHSVVPRNGTTYSGRHQKYVYHCSQYAGQSGSEYLTPTQRAQKHIRRLRELLSQAKLQIDEKESEILKLTQEVIDLRSFKASLGSPEERSNSSDAVTVKENAANDFANSSNDASPITADVTIDLCKPNGHPFPDHYKILIDKTVVSEMHSSFADSGLFEDMTNMSLHSKDSMIATRDQATCVDSYIDEDRQALIEMYERKIEDLIKINDNEKQDVAQKYNDKIESLLQKLSEANIRLHTMFPDLEQAKERVHELEIELEALQTKLEQQEDKANKMYLHMVIQNEDTLQKHKNAAIVMNKEKVTVSELVDQLNLTHQELSCLKDVDYASDTHTNLLSAKEAISLWLLGAKKEMYGRLVEAQQQKHRMDPDVKLQFLKSAIFYFLTSSDRNNSDIHLNAIESILEFSEAEKEHIHKIRRNACQ